MRRFKLQISAAAFAVAVLSLASWGFAQQNEPNARPGQPGQPQAPPAQPGQQIGQAILDQMAAEGILQMNKGEIELANFALKHTQNEEVRKFAQTIIDDQTNLNNQLQRFVGEKGAGQGTNPPAGNSATQPGQPTTQPAQPTTPGTPVTQPGREAAGPTAQAGGAPGESWKAMSIDTIRRDVANQVIAAIQRELAQYQGSDFDRAYVGQQFWGHVEFVAAAKAGSKHLSNDLRQVVEQGAQTGEKRLEECRKLIRNLASNVARSTEATPRR
jgi:predicted outer membrane protein